MKNERFKFAILKILFIVLFLVGSNAIFSINEQMEGIWKDEENNIYLIIKGKKVIEYVIKERLVLSKNIYRIINEENKKYQLILVRSKSTSYPVEPGTIFHLECLNNSITDEFICHILVDGKPEKESSRKKFNKVTEKEFEEFLKMFSDKYKNSASNNWSIPVDSQ